MVIDLRKIIRSGKEEESFFFEYCPDLTVDVPDGELILPVRIGGTVKITGRHSAFIEGEIEFTVKGDCTRCLTPTEKTFNMTFAETAGEDESDYPVVNDTVDLSKIADDKILTSIPVSFLCKDDCKGLCPVCGANLNDGEHKCK